MPVSAILPQMFSQTSLVSTPALNERAISCIEKNGDYNKFLESYGISKMDVYITNHYDRMFVGTAPTLATMRVAYGDKETMAWIALYLVDISKFKGIVTKSDSSAIVDAAKMIVTNYGKLKATELMVFFNMFKSSKFRGRDNDDLTTMYGEFQCSVIMNCLELFSSFRVGEITRIENETKSKDESQPILYDDWVKLMNNKPKEI